VGYSTEIDLFEEALESSFISYHLNRKSAIKLIEPKGLFGIPDLLIAQKDQSNTYYSIAFEMKLRKWKRALNQAYRYKSFSEYVYVVMDDKFVGPALKNLDKFKKSNVGLVSIKNGRVSRHYLPKRDEPYYLPHKEKLLSFIQSGKI